MHAPLWRQYYIAAFKKPRIIILNFFSSQDFCFVYALKSKAIQRNNSVEVSKHLVMTAKMSSKNWIFRCLNFLMKWSLQRPHMGLVRTKMDISDESREFWKVLFEEFVISMDLITFHENCYFGFIAHGVNVNSKYQTFWNDSK